MQGFLDESGLFIFYLFFCILRRNSKWPPKVAGHQFLGKIASRLCGYPVGQKLRRKLLLSHSVSEINTFLRFTQKFKMAVKSDGKTFFEKKNLAPFPR